MPRRARLLLPEVPIHIIQRGNNRQACFYTPEDYSFYLEWLTEYAGKAGCRIHGYVLMTNHVHLLLSSSKTEGPGKLMKALGQRDVQYVNRHYRRSGSLWEGRFRSCLVQEEAYLLACHRYIELNPVRADMVRHPADYPWSSYRINGQGEPSELIKPHPLYEALGKDDAERQAAYRQLFRHKLDSDVMDVIRSATHGNYALGDERFADQISAAIGRRASRGRAGRPIKVKNLLAGKMNTLIESAGR